MDREDPNLSPLFDAPLPRTIAPRVLHTPGFPPASRQQSVRPPLVLATTGTFFCILPMALFRSVDLVFPCLIWIAITLGAAVVLRGLLLCNIRVLRAVAGALLIAASVPLVLLVVLCALAGIGSWEVLPLFVGVLSAVQMAALTWVAYRAGQTLMNCSPPGRVTHYCPACHYDLRTTDDSNGPMHFICPECGLVMH